MKVLRCTQGHTKNTTYGRYQNPSIEYGRTNLVPYWNPAVVGWIHLLSLLAFQLRYLKHVLFVLSPKVKGLKISGAVIEGTKILFLQLSYKYEHGAL